MPYSVCVCARAKLVFLSCHNKIHTRKVQQSLSLTQPVNAPNITNCCQCELSMWMRLRIRVRKAERKKKNERRNNVKSCWNEWSKLMKRNNKWKTANEDEDGEEEAEKKYQYPCQSVCVCAAPATPKWHNKKGRKKTTNESNRIEYLHE